MADLPKLTEPPTAIEIAEVLNALERCWYKRLAHVVRRLAYQRDVFEEALNKGYKVKHEGSEP